MKNRIKISAGIIAFLTGIILLIPSCTEEKAWDTILYETGTFDATSTSTSIQGGDSVVFTDLSTRVYSREWSFLGGDPASSTDSIVTVRYDQGSVDTIPYVAKLVVTYIDNTTQTREFYIDVEGSILATYSIFTEDESKTYGTSAVLESNPGYAPEIITGGAFEGEESIYFKYDGTNPYAMSTIKCEPWGSTVDISAFADGTYNLALKSTCSDTMLIRLQDVNNERGIITLYPDNTPGQDSYGFIRDGNWHFISIPMADFLTNNPNLDLTIIQSLLVLRSGSTKESIAGEDWDFYLDHFYLQEAVSEE